MSRVLHTYVALRARMFDTPKKELLKAFLDAKRATAPQSAGEGGMGLDADELWILENAAT